MVEDRRKICSCQQQHFNTIFELIASKWIDLLNNKIQFDFYTIYTLVNIIFNSFKTSHIQI